MCGSGTRTKGTSSWGPPHLGTFQGSILAVVRSKCRPMDDQILRISFQLFDIQGCGLAFYQPQTALTWKQTRLLCGFIKFYRWTPFTRYYELIHHIPTSNSMVCRLNFMRSSTAHCINLAQMWQMWETGVLFRSFFYVGEFLQVIKCGAILTRCCNQWKKKEKGGFVDQCSYKNVFVLHYGSSQSRSMKSPRITLRQVQFSRPILDPNIISHLKS